MLTGTQLNTNKSAIQINNLPTNQPVVPQFPVIAFLVVMLRITMLDSASTTKTTPGLCIAATASGTGKTTIATGLMAALAKKHAVAPFKIGPDYIDPGYHSMAAGRVGRNLDSVMCGSHRIGPLYRHGTDGCDIAVVEGVMGLFDGRLHDGAGSTAEIAQLLGLPVLLVVDVRGMSQSVGPLVKGFAAHAPGVHIAGVILNKAGTPRHAQVCSNAIEAEGIPVVGVIPRQQTVHVPSRHLGLITATEHGEMANTAVAHMAELIEKFCDVEQIINLARCKYNGPSWQPTAEVKTVGTPTIAMAAGPVFSFAYAEHQELLTAAGATVIRFDPLSDPLPACDGLIIPGGFPEEYAEKLATKTELKQAIKAHAAAGKPIHGECAGLLWLLDTLDNHPMLGIIGTTATMGQGLQLGYREAVALTDSLLYRAGERVIGHEFHHTALATSTASGFDPAWGWPDSHGKAIKEGFVATNLHASYLHIHPAAAPLSVERFVAACT